MPKNVDKLNQKFFTVRILELVMAVNYCWTRQTYVQRTKGDGFLNYFDVSSDALCVSAFIVPSENNAILEDRRQYKNKVCQSCIPDFSSHKGLVESFASPKSQPEGLLRRHYARGTAKIRNARSTDFISKMPKTWIN